VTSSDVIEDWRDWIEEAHAVVSAWERDTRGGHMLRIREAAMLAEGIARGMHREYVRGQAESSAE
jgi:hypothetical protein